MSNLIPLLGFLVTSMVAAVVSAVPTAIPADRSSEDDLPPAEALESDGDALAIGSIDLRYIRENPLHPSIDDLTRLPFTLGRTTTGYVAPREDTPLVTLTCVMVSRRDMETYHESALQTIIETIRDELVRRDLLGVFVGPDPNQFSQAGDLRAEGDTSFTLLISTGIVTEMRSVASGERVGEKSEIKPEERIDHPLHRRILERSPVRPYSLGDADGSRRDLLRKRDLDRYLFHLSRHPGRRVDAAVAAAQDVGGMALDYLITENRPLVIYGQASNTGTSSTDRWRERFGFFHTQLTNNDDILSVDYITANFDDLHAIVASYEAPFSNDRIRWKVLGGWSRYQASDVGIFDDEFRGENWFAGAEVAANVHQHREFFLDLVGGARFENIRVENDLFLIEGEEDFLFPYAGVRFDRTTEWVSSFGEVLVEWQIADWTGADVTEMEKLGRTQPDEDWAVLKWNFTQLVYLEPLFNRAAWEDPTTPESSTLAHEVQVSFRGQYAFDQRLIPQSQQVVGGLYTVRGYPESILAGDTTLVGSVEYRFHLPRIFGIETEPREMFGRPFRFAPQYVYGTPDWDLILKAFFDVGQVITSDPFSFEQDQTIYGTGVGLEFLWRRNLNVRLDWGFALEDLESGDVHSGSNRLHMVFTLLF